MEYTTLGRTGMTVSRLCLGTYSFGATSDDDWRVDEKTASAIVNRALDAGINFFDTSNSYSGGESERILGEALGDERERAVIASKCFFETDETDPNSGGLSRKAIERAIEGSKSRLGVECIDLYQTHRWDYDTPIEATIRTLADLQRRGDVLALGASSMWAHQFASAQHVARDLGVEPFVTMQAHYNLVYREEEREMLPYCVENDVAVLPWSPLGGGYLARPHDELTSTTRGSVFEDRDLPYLEGAAREINGRVRQLAEERDVDMAQIALAWLLANDFVTTPIIGATRPEHVDDAVSALSIDLSDDDVAFLEEPYEPIPVSGHI